MLLINFGAGLKVCDPKRARTQSPKTSVRLKKPQKKPIEIWQKVNIVVHLGMKFINGFDRNQLHFFAYEELSSKDNDVRLIDVLDLQRCGFDMDFGENGRPAYHPGDLLEIFIYGYLNRIRSSRALEKGSLRNIEMR